MKKLLFLLSIILAPLAAVAQEPYAVYTSETVDGSEVGTLTFYYDEQKEARGGMDVELSYESSNYEYNARKRGWNSKTYYIRTVVFDASFANCTTITSTHVWFHNCYNLTTITGIENLKTENVTDMGEMFSNCYRLTSLDLSHFDTGNVTSMSGMFSSCSRLTSLDLSNFDTGNVAVMSFMFFGCSKLTSLDVSHFDTGSVTDMSAMFYGCSSLTSLDVSHFDTGNVTSMYNMFYGCSGLTSLNLSHFNTGNVTKMNYLFYNCSSLTSLDVNHFDTKNVADMSFMFYGCKSLTSLDVSHFDTKNVTDMSGMFYGCKSLTNLDVSHFDTKNVTDMSGMFYGCSSLTSLDVSHFDTSSVIQMGKSFYNNDGVPEYWGMFSGCSNVTELDVSNFVTNNVTSMTAMFLNCSGLTSLDLSHFDTKNVIDMGQMFRGCSSLENLNVSHFNTEKVISMWSMFYGCYGLTSLDVSHFDTGNVTSMGEMFSGCYRLTSLDVSHFDTGNVTSMSSMFSGCSGLTSLDLSRFDTGNVTDMNYMFSGCSGLTSLDVSHFDTGNVTDMSSMFRYCSGLTSLNVSNFDTGNVTRMNSMFYDCKNLVSILCNDTWNPSINSSSMFLGCEKLQGYNSGKVTVACANPENGYFTKKHETAFSLGDNYWMAYYTNVRNIKADDNTTVYIAKLNDDGQTINLIEILDKLVPRGEAVLLKSTVPDPVLYTSFDDYTYDFTDNSLEGTEREVETISLGEGIYIPDYSKSDLIFDLCVTNTIAANGVYLNLNNTETNQITIKDVINGGKRRYPYIVYSYTNKGGELTFYYDANREERGGYLFEPFYSWRDIIWYSVSIYIKSVVFDESFAKCKTINSTAYWFYNCVNLTSISGLNYLNTENVTNMDYMFYNCSSLTSLDVSHFDTGKVTNMSMLFRGCYGLTSLDLSHFDTGNVTDMGGMFYNCSALTSLDLSHFDTGNVKSMGSMFSGCSGLTSLDLSHFDTGNVTNMSYMFSGCNNLMYIIVGTGWNTSNVTQGTGMYNDCYDLAGAYGTIYDGNNTDYTYAHVDGGTDNPGYLTAEGSPVSKTRPYAVLNDDKTHLTFYFDNQREEQNGYKIYKTKWTNNALTITMVTFDASFANYSVINTSSWFKGCKNLTIINGIENLNTENVTDMSSMFYGCSSLSSLDLSHFDTGNVTNMEEMFTNCSGLTSLDVSHFNTGNVKYMWRMFSGCSKLTSLDVSHFDTGNVTNMEEMFTNCSGLTSLTLPTNISKIGKSSFEGCDNLAELISLNADVPTVETQDYDPSKTTLYVNPGCKAAYAAADFWKDFKEIVELEPSDVENEMEEGWNWMSTNLLGGDNRNTQNFIADVKTAVSRLISQTSELVYDPVYDSLIGNLSTLNPASGYKMVLSEDATLSKEGFAVSLNTPVPLYKGWTWLGYIPTKTLPVSTALANLAATEGDRLLCEDEFAEYKNGAWTGDLEVMEPGKGYIYHRMGEDVTFSYSDGSAASRAANVGAGSEPARAASVGADPVSARIAVAKALENRAARKAALQQAPWQYNSHRYPDNTTIIAQIAETDYHGANPYIIGAFCGDECRGIGKMFDGRIFLTVHGTIGTREPIRFLAYELTTGETLDISEHIAFEGQCLGTLDNPVQLHAVGTTDGINGIIAGSKAFDVYTVSGQLVRSQATSLQDLAPGVYVVGGRKVLVK